MRATTPMALILLLLSACGSPNSDVTAGPEGGKTVNGSVHVPAGLHSGDVGTVNGEVEVAENAVVKSVRAVNGEIELGAHAAADSITTVNGEVKLAQDAHVQGGITTVNGGVNLAGGTDIGGAVKNVNGHIVLNGAHVAGGLRTVSGDIDVGSGSKVDGGILVQKSSSWFGSSGDTRKPRIVIGPGAVVQGDLRFERDVELYVSDKATIGPVSGATPVSFSGDKPPA